LAQLVCVDANRWRRNVFLDEGPEDILKFWCLECWLREFGS